MARIVAGIDISANQDIGDDRYVAIVIGTRESINSIIKNLKIKEFHNREIKLSKNRSDLASKLQFNGIENMALCLKIERNRIVNEIIKLAHKKRSRVSRKKIIAEYNHYLFQYVREMISTFALKHHNSLSDVIFECDSDCRDFLKNNALKYGDEGYAYKLSDIVAWANNKDREPRGVRSMDLTDKIKTTLRHDLK